MTLTLELLLSLLGGGLTLAGFWVGIARWIASELGKRDLAIQLADQRAKLAEEVITKALNDHKLYAAETFATTHEVTAALGRVEAAIGRLSDRLDKILDDKISRAERPLV